MLIIECTGTPYEIGHTHGTLARPLISRTLTFYTNFFLSKSRKSWHEVRSLAAVFSSNIQKTWPAYHEELRGIADGSGHDLLDIVALNVRTEVAFGLFNENDDDDDDDDGREMEKRENEESDGCTSVSFHSTTQSLVGQNLDWLPEQKSNLVILKIHPFSSSSSPLPPHIITVTEAGLFSKIGLNSLGVGVCLNAIRAAGCDATKLPVHLGLRMALECSSAHEAASRLENEGMASSAHILIADSIEGVGCEFTSSTFARLAMSANGTLVHTNHLLGSHPGAKESSWLDDSAPRLERMNELVRELAKRTRECSIEELGILFEDEMGFPASICRKCDGDKGSSETLFNIVMDLRRKGAVVKVGRPVAVDEIIQLNFL